MNIISFFAGLILFLVGAAYLYRPTLVYKINLLAREYIFNDRLLLGHRRKVGVMLMVLGALILFFTL